MADGTKAALHLRCEGQQGPASGTDWFGRLEEEVEVLVLFPQASVTNLTNIYLLLFDFSYFSLITVSYLRLHIKIMEIQMGIIQRL